MVKTAKAPRGFYTASEAMKILGLASSSFYDLVKAGKLTRVVPPGRKDGYYPKSQVDAIIKAKELFVLEYATDESIFEKAQEEDIKGITDLSIELFGKSGTATYETRLAQYHANPDIFYVLKQDDLIVGYLGLFPLKQAAIDKIMSGVEESFFRTELLTPENITQFTPNEADNVFLIIGVRQNLRRSKIYGARLINGGIEVLEHLARRGIIVKYLYATSRTQDGIRLCKGLGFKQVTPAFEEDDLLRFRLDLETTEHPLFKKYQRIIRRATGEAKR